MNEKEIHAIVDQAAEAAAKKAVRETLVTLGVDVDRPMETQRDMQHLRAWREAVSTIKKQGLITAIGIVTAGVIGAIWLAIKGPSG